ncbi:hypothetical protein B0G69_4514 [Paraburkholderia sp. RAU2J]|nr:hypothetical protein B0G69_4514 [Paraburkholderia sp. RAU2J]
MAQCSPPASRATGIRSFCRSCVKSTRPYRLSLRSTASSTTTAVTSVRRSRRGWQRAPLAHAFHSTYSSWLNQVECFFALITDKAIRRGSFGSVRQLIASISSFPTTTKTANHSCRPPPLTPSSQSCKDFVRESQLWRRQWHAWPFWSDTVETYGFRAGTLPGAPRLSGCDEAPGRSAPRSWRALLSPEVFFFLGALSDAIRFKVCNCSSFKSRSFVSALPVPARPHPHTKPTVSVHLIIIDAWPQDGCWKSGEASEAARRPALIARSARGKAAARPIRVRPAAHADRSCTRGGMPAVADRPRVIVFPRNILVRVVAQSRSGD